MAYVTVDAPLPPNSLDGVNPCVSAYNQRIVRSVENAVAAARQASAMIATPDQFSEFGPGVMRDAARSQRELIAGQTLMKEPKRNGSAEALRTAPTVVPLNVSKAEFSGCSVRNIGPPTPIPISIDQTRVLMPAPAPTDTGLLTSGNQFPVPNAVMASPPTVPYKGVILPDVDTRPRGYAAIVQPGMGSVPWGDATAYHAASGGTTGGMTKSGWWLLGLGALGLFAATRGKRGRR